MEIHLPNLLGAMRGGVGNDKVHSNAFKKNAIFLIECIISNSWGLLFIDHDIFGEEKSCPVGGICHTKVSPKTETNPEHKEFCFCSGVE